MNRRTGLLLGIPLLWALAACSGLPTASNLSPSTAEKSLKTRVPSAGTPFTLQGRFALSLTPATEAPQHFSGRLTWTVLGAQQQLTLASPLGNTLAELDVTPGRARLHTQKGERYDSDDAERLLSDITGTPLPVKQLPFWLFGRHANGNAQEASNLIHDVQGRPQQLRDADWTIDYHYNDASPLPARLDIQHRQGQHTTLRLILRIDDWEIPE